MPDLVTLQEFKDHIGDTSSMDFDTPQGADDYLTSLLDRVEDLLEREVGLDFHAAGTGRVETHDGHGSDWIYVERPVDTLTSIKIGFDPNDPDETLDTVPDDIQAVKPRGSSRADKVARRDGGVFPRGTANLHVTYDHDAYKPAAAKAALLEGAAYILRRRGSEHAASRTVGEFGSTQYAALFDNLPMWRRALALKRRRAA